MEDLTRSEPMEVCGERRSSSCSDSSSYVGPPMWPTKAKMGAFWLRALVLFCFSFVLVMIIVEFTAPQDSTRKIMALVGGIGACVFILMLFCMVKAACRGDLDPELPESAPQDTLQTAAPLGYNNSAFVVTPHNTDCAYISGPPESLANTVSMFGNYPVSPPKYEDVIQMGICAPLKSPLKVHHTLPALNTQEPPSYKDITHHYPANPV